MALPLIPWLTLWATLLHPFYVSVTEINHNAEAQSLEISIKMFSDDLEEALNQRFGETMNLGLDDEHPDADVYLALYLQDELKLSADGTPLTFTYVGKDAGIEATWAFVEATDVAALQVLSVRNALLTEQFDTQKNMVHVHYQGQTQSLLLQRRNLSGEVKF